MNERFGTFSNWRNMRKRQIIFIARDWPLNMMIFNLNYGWVLVHTFFSICIRFACCLPNLIDDLTSRINLPAEYLHLNEMWNRRINFEECDKALLSQKARICFVAFLLGKMFVISQRLSWFRESNRFECSKINWIDV